MACTTASYNICIEQGADLSLPITVEGLDLTGATAEMDVRETIASTSEFMTLSTANGKITIVGQLVTLILNATETASFATQYVYDIFITTSDTKKHKILKGKLLVDFSVTR